MKREATVRKKENGVKGGQGPSPKKARVSLINQFIPFVFLFSLSF